MVNCLPLTNPWNIKKHDGDGAGRTAQEGAALMEIEVSFPGSKKVRAECQGFIVETDQPAERGGDETALNPFDLFLCSLATCTGFDVLSFLQERGLRTEEARVVVRASRSARPPLVERVAIEIRIPQSFPRKYAEAIARAASQCKVRAQLFQPPEFTISVVPLKGGASSSAEAWTAGECSDD